MKIKISLIIMIIFFIGCGNNQPSIPKWYLNVPQDNDKYLYASGEGDTKAQAINNALANISAKIQTQIKSTFVSNMSIDNKQISKHLSQTIIQKTKNLSFTDYKIIKIAHKKKYYIFLKINRQKNANLMLQNIKNKFQNLNIPTNKIILLKKIDTLKKQLIDLKSNLFLAKNIYTNIDIIPTLTKINNLLDKLQKIKENIVFNIQNNSDYSDILKDYLTQKGYKIGSSNLKILLNIQENKFKINDYYIIKANVKIIFKQKEILYTKEIITGGYKLQTSSSINFN